VATDEDCIWEISGPGGFATNSQALYLGNEGGTYRDATGIRFIDAVIPPGSTILSAKVILRAAANKSGTVVVRISGVDEDNAAVVARAADAEGRPLTTAYVDWSITADWTADQDYETPELKTIIQEIVDRAGWSIGNALLLFLKDNSTGDGINRTVRAWDYSSTFCPRLVVTLTLP
jgi:hypothetical protein